MKIMKNFENFNMDGESEIILSNLLDEIEDRSLQIILRRVIFNGDKIQDVLIEERPELKTNPKKLNKLKNYSE
jgi:hypothetical protein